MAAVAGIARLELLVAAEAVGARADAEVYAEATARVHAASGQRPEVHELADVIARLGKLSGGVTTPATAVREPVPDWLARP